jgi:hypothetical protein
MPDYVRVADKETGHHLSITRRRYDAAPELWRELKSDATYADGEPRPAKHKTSVSTEAAKKSTTSGQTADEKE